MRDKSGNVELNTIVNRFGKVALQEARAQYCSNCSSRLPESSICSRELLPYTTGGELCPYRVVGLPQPRPLLM